MEPQPYFADERGILRTRIAAVPQHGLSFEERTNSLLEQPLPLDCVLQGPTQPLHFQPADTQTRSSIISHSGQNSFEDFFPGVQGQAGSAIHGPATGSGLISDGSTRSHEIDQLGKSTSFPESPVWNFCIPAVSSASKAGGLPFAEPGGFSVSSASTAGVLPFAEHGGFSISSVPTSGLLPFAGPVDPAQFYLVDPSFCSQNSTKCNDGVPASTNLSSVYLPAGGDWSGPNEVTYAENFSTPGPMVPHQHSVPYLEYGINEISPFTATPGEQTLPLPIPEPQHQCSQPPRDSRGRKRKQEEVTGVIDIAGTRLPSKRRSFANRAQREQTARVRDMGACIRCAIQKNGCLINPADPEGICKRCQNLGTTMDNLPCMRAKFMDSILFRNSVDPSSGRPDFSIHFNTGIEKAVTEWNSVETRTIELIQGFGSILRLRVRKARALNLASVRPSQRFMYQHPWALLDFREAMDDMARFIMQSIERAVTSKVDKEDKLAYTIFRIAFGMAFGVAHQKEKPSELLQNVLKLWTASRCIEGGWHFCGSDTLDLPADKKGITHLTDAKIIDAQLSSIFVLHFLGILQKRVLEPIHRIACSSDLRKTHWFEVFLANFILLHNFECVIKQQRKWARENDSKFRYTEKMWELVKGILFSSKNILWYFHYGLKGQYPFQEDWKSDSGQPKIAELSKKECSLVRFIAGEVERKLPTWRELQKTEEYETPGWFTSQLFLSEWKPPKTTEIIPPAP